MKLVKFSDPILKQPSKNFDFINPPFDIIEFSQKLVRMMYESNGITLAAIQVGVPYRIFAMRGAPENFICVNSKVVMPSKETIRLEETSLTYPGLIVKIKRPQHCRVRFAMPNGDVRTDTFTGITARVFQHSTDFLDGKLFYHGANPIHRTQALKKWKHD